MKGLVIGVAVKDEAGTVRTTMADAMAPGAVGTACATSDAASPGAVAPVGAPAAEDVAGKRIDIISDTHGLLSDVLLAQLEGADLIIHAGDITSDADWLHLQAIAPIKAVLGNNDWPGEYGPEVGRSARFTYEGLEFAVSHFREMLPVDEVDVAVCGHTHRARVERLGRCTVVNPGSASYPRGGRGATIARMHVAQGRILSLEIVDL